jgi:hypothetical protein
LNVKVQDNLKYDRKMTAPGQIRKTHTVVRRQHSQRSLVDHLGLCESNWIAAIRLELGSILCIGSTESFRGMSARSSSSTVQFGLAHIACLAMSNPFFRSSAFITGSNSTLALRPWNKSSTIPGMSDASFHVKKHHRATTTMLCYELSSFGFQLAHGASKISDNEPFFNCMVAGFCWYQDFKHHTHVPRPFWFQLYVLTRAPWRCSP